MIHQLIQENYASIIVCILLILFLTTNDYFSQKITRQFLVTISLVLVLSVADSLEYISSTWNEPTFLRKITSAIGYTLRPMVAYMIIQILNRDNSKKRIWLNIPLILNMIISFSGCFCSIAFTYSKENYFVRGPLGYIPFIISGFYLLMMIVYTFIL